MKIGSIDLKHIALVLITIAFSPLLICSLLAYLAPVDRLFELMTHFRFQYLLGGILAVIIYAVIKYRIGILVALFWVGLNAIEILPWYLPIDRQIDRNLRVMVSNVLTSNQRYGDFLDFVRSSCLVYIQGGQCSHAPTD